MNDAYPYVVRQGDHFRQLAHVGGYDADEVWNDPLNDGLRELRGSGDDLLPGDVIFVPETPQLALDLIPTVENEFTAVIPRIKLDLFFEDTDGPIADEACNVFGLPGSPEEGTPKTSNGDGGLLLHVPVTVPELTITFPDRHRSFTIRIGHMDPLEEQSGVVKRLANLGYLAADFAHGDGDISAAIVAFQKRAGLDVTGQLDEPTKARLDQEAGVPPTPPDQP